MKKRRRIDDKEESWHEMNARRRLCSLIYPILSYPILSYTFTRSVVVRQTTGERHYNNVAATMIHPSSLTFKALLRKPVSSSSSSTSSKMVLLPSPKPDSRGNGSTYILPARSTPNSG